MLLYSKNNISLSFKPFKEFVKAKIQGLEDEADNYIEFLLNNSDEKVC